MTLDLFLQTLINSIPTMARYALVTMGIVLIFRTTGTTNFAQGLIACTGEYLITQLALINGVPVWIAIILGMILAFLLGIFMDTALMRNAKGITASGKQMITMGMLLILTYVNDVVFEQVKYMTGGPVISYASVTLFTVNNVGISITENGIWCVCLAIVILVAVFMALKYTKWGLGVRSTATNETVAQMLGVNTKVITAFSWALSGAMATLGAFFTGAGSFISVGLMGNAQVYGFLACVLGGFSSFAAPILGCIIIPLIYNFAGLTQLMGPDAAIWQNAVTFAVVLLLILIFPNGLLGHKTVKKV